MITGICKSKILIDKILISPRNKLISQKLKKKFKIVNSKKDNQEIINSCNWIFLSITPSVGKKIIKNLRFVNPSTLLGDRNNNFISVKKSNKS